jgi:hypothetical protein
LKNPDSPDFPEFPDFFPEYPGLTLKTLIHKCCASPPLIISHFHILFPIQMVRVKVRRETEEPPPKGGPRLGMTPPLCGPCKRPWGKKDLSAVLGQEEVTLLPPMPKGVKKK